MSIANKICELCKNGLTFESLLKEVFNEYDLTMNPNQYILIGSTVKSYLSYLYDEGRITYIFKDNKMYWKQV